MLMDTLRKSTDLSIAGISFAGCMLMFGTITLAAMTAMAKPDAESVAAVFPLWWSEQQSLLAAASAGAAIIRLGGLSSIVVVQPSLENGTQRLRQAGAWITLDPLALDACLKKLKIAQ